MNKLNLALLLAITLPLSAAAAITTVHKDFKAGAGTTLSVRSVSGAIAVSTGAAGAVTADITYDPENCKVTAETRGKTVYLEAKQNKIWKMFSFGSKQEPCAAFAVTAPAGIQADLLSVSGDIAVENLGGPVTGKTVSGDVNVNGRGELTLTTVSGSVKLSDAAGKLRLNTTSGDISGYIKSSEDLEARTVSGKVTLEVQNAPQKGAYGLDTVSGALELTFPKGAKANASLTSVSGDQKNGIINDPAAAFKITAKTTSGDLIINGK